VEGTFPVVLATRSQAVEAARSPRSAETLALEMTLDDQTVSLKATPALHWDLGTWFLSSRRIGTRREPTAVRVVPTRGSPRKVSISQREGDHCSRHRDAETRLQQAALRAPVLTSPAGETVRTSKRHRECGMLAHDRLWRR